MWEGAIYIKLKYLCKYTVYVYESHKKRKGFGLIFDCGCDVPVNFFLACSVFEILKDK